MARINIKAILADNIQRKKLIESAVDALVDAKWVRDETLIPHNNKGDHTMNHEEAINTVAALPLSVNLGGEVGVIITKDVDGFEVTATNHSTNKKRTLRYDAVKGLPGQYVRYDVDKKPTTRTHEVVVVGNDPVSWVYDNLDYYINLVEEG